MRMRWVGHVARMEARAVAGSGEYGDESSGSVATELVI
jgi:hypothetical protein